MNCPTCSHPLEHTARTCPNCATEFSLADWTQLHQYSYLLEETGSWESFNWRSRRRVIAKRAAEFSAQWASVGEDEVEADSAEMPHEPQPNPDQTNEEQAPPEPEAARASTASQPFDQWLFSERTIKSALYSGAFLLILAGMIFVGANWGRLAWTTKLAVIAAQTIFMTILGLRLLRQSASLRIGGLALTAVAAGFAPLNTWLIQHYWLRPTWDFNPYLMLFLGGMLCAGFYIWLMRQTKSMLHSLSASLAVGASFVGLTLTFTEGVDVVMLACAVIALGLLTVSHLARGWEWIAKPPRVIAYATATIVATLAGLMLMVNISDFILTLRESSVLLAALATSALLFALAEHWRGSDLFGYPKYGSLLAVSVLGALQWRWDRPYPELLIMAGAGLFLLAYFRPIQSARLRTFVVSLVTAFLGIAIAVNQTINPDLPLASVLAAAVVYLFASYLIRKQTLWLHLAAWLLIGPIAILAWEFSDGLFNRALWLAGLMAVYVVASYIWTRFELVALAPAVALSALAVIVAWDGVLWGCALLLVVIGLGYVMLSRRFPVLLVGGLISAEFLIWTLLRADLFPLPLADPFAPHVLSYAALGFTLILVAALSRDRSRLWCQLAYAAGALNLAAAYAGAQTVDPVAIRIGLAFLLAAAFIAIAWRERKDLFTIGHGAGGLTAAALIFIYVGHIQLMLELKPYFPGQIDTAAIVTVVLCASFVLIGLTQRAKIRNLLFGQPLNWLGLGLMLLPLTNATNNRNIFATVAAIAGLTILFDGWKRTDAQSWRLYQLYIGIGVLFASYFAILDANSITNLQAYALPLGLALVLIGWNERRRNVTLTYLAFSLAGLVVLFGSAFVQSLEDSVIYAYLLLVESVIAVRWGIITRSRGYVQLGIIALVANGIAQFGPAFNELPRFAQVGSIGSILLLGGMLALFQREKLLATQDTWRREWAKWNP